MTDLIHRQVEGWHLCSRDGADWRIRDLELAERAGLAKPQDIRNTVRGVLADLAKNDDAGSAGIIISAEKTLVPMPRGGHREVTEYLLNREAALHVLMRLRTKRAVALQVEIVRVFVAVADGVLTGEELRALREENASFGAELALFKNQVVKLTTCLAEVETRLLLGSGYVSTQQRAQIRSAKARAADAMVRAAESPNRRSALRELQNGIQNHVGWGNGGQSDNLLPIDLFTRVLAYLNHRAMVAERHWRSRAQLVILETPNPTKVGAA